MKAKRKSIKEKPERYKMTRPRFGFSVVATFLGFLYLICGIAMLYGVFNYDESSLMPYGVISPGLLSIGVGLFQILSFVFRGDRNLWKLCTSFSLVCIFGVAISFMFVYLNYLNTLGVFIGVISVYSPLLVCQIVILTTDLELHKKSLKEFDIARGERKKGKHER